MALSYTEAQVDEKLTPAYAGIYAHENSTAQAIATGTTYAKVVNFAVNEPSSGCTSDYANNQITITKTGVYKVKGSFSFSSGTNNTDILMAAFLNGVEQEGVHFSRTIGTIGSIGSAPISGTINVTSVPVNLDVRCRHDAVGSVNLTFQYMNLGANRIDII